MSMRLTVFEEGSDSGLAAALAAEGLAVERVAPPPAEGPVGELAAGLRAAEAALSQGSR